MPPFYNFLITQNLKLIFQNKTVRFDQYDILYMLITNVYTFFCFILYKSMSYKNQRLEVTQISAFF